MSRKALQSDLPLPEAGIQGGLDGRLGNFFEKTLKSCFIPSPLGGGEHWEFFFGGFPHLDDFFLDVGVDLVGLEAFLGQRIGEVLISHGGSCSLFLWVY